jgi:hypothetical protein
LTAQSITHHQLDHTGFARQTMDPDLNLAASQEQSVVAIGEDRTKDIRTGWLEQSGGEYRTIARRKQHYHKAEEEHQKILAGCDLGRR